MTVEELPGYLRAHWPQIQKELLSGAYAPQPVKRVGIPKPTGGIRELGVPVALDRLIQQAILRYSRRSLIPHSPLIVTDSDQKEAHTRQ